MYFKRIDLQGFKSFADPVSIEFHEGITCIVGPNGSGKSNISDALRWVLGEQSPKMLRGGKMEEVIFAGTMNRKSRGMAEVTLVIDNSRGILPIDYSEVAITRRMYRSGESEYAINNTACRLRDIRELIMDTGIGVEGYSIIGQGKISEIVSSRPESRREIFEEAAGIVKYRSRKAEAERKLQNSGANLERVSDIIGEIEGRIDRLAEDSRKAKEFIGLREKQKTVEINITLKNIEAVELKNEYLKDELAELGAEIDGFQKKKESIEAGIAQKRAQGEQLNQQEEQQRDLLMQQVQEIGNIESQTQLNRQRLSTAQSEQERLVREIASLQEKLSLEEHNVQQTVQSKGQLSQQLAELNDSLAELQKEQEEQESAAAALSRQVEEQKDRLYSLSAQAGQRQTEISGLNNLKETLSRRKVQLLSDTEAADSGNSQIAQECAQIEEELRALARRQEKTTQEGNAQRQRQSLLRKEEQTLRKTLEELRISIGAAQTKQRMIQDLENSYDGYNGAVKFIMRQGLSGIEGLVAELIEVPKGLETAIETALGAALQNVVCKDDASAQRAVEALKEARAGRLTFLPVQSIRGSRPGQAEGLRTMEGFRGLGVECVSFDSRYQGIAEYLLGRVVIVDTLANAVAMSKRASSGLRFVTLEGEVVNVSGAITGGRYKTNSANLLSRKAEIHQLAESLSQLSQQKTEADAAYAHARESLSATEEQLSQLSQQYRDGQLAQLEKEKQLQLRQAQIAELSNSSDKRQRELLQLQKEEASAEEMIGSLRGQLQKQQEESSQAEELLAGWIPQLAQEQEQVQYLLQEVTARRMEINTVEERRAAAVQMERRMAASIEDMKRQQQERSQQIEALKEERQQLLSGDDGLLQKRETLLQQKEEAEQTLSRLLQQKAQLSQDLAELEKEQSELSQKLFAQQQKKYDAEVKLARNDTQISTWKDKLWEDFEISYLQAMEFENKDFILAQAQKESRELRLKIKALGDVNVGAIQEYETTRQRYDFLSEQRTDLLSAMDALRKIIDDMDKTIRRSFKESFDQIAINFEEAFTRMFGGGMAQLRMENESHPLESGIEIVAQPPGKKLQNINLMSGGEKTMTAIALMFAVLKAKPTPFCILDEVEAALDEANIDRFARYLKNFEGIQFALVTHQKATMEYADVLYGVTMPEQGISRVLSLRMGDDFEV